MCATQVCVASATRRHSLMYFVIAVAAGADC